MALLRGAIFPPPQRLPAAALYKTTLSRYNA